MSCNEDFAEQAACPAKSKGSLLFFLAVESNLTTRWCQTGVQDSRIVASPDPPETGYGPRSTALSGHSVSFNGTCTKLG
jgi:hypothetical protein